MIKNAIQLQQTRRQGIYHQFLRPVEHKISEKAIYIAATIYNRFMPDTDLNKPRIREECSGLAIHTTGIPCIHTMLRAERGLGLSAADFHRHWHLPPSINHTSTNHTSTNHISTNHISTNPASTCNPPIPASQVQNPPKAVTRGRPPASSARQAISQTQRSTQRSPSQFEIIEQQIIAGNQAFEASRAASQASQASQASAASAAGWEASEDKDGGLRRSGRAPRPKRRRTDETSQGETTETDY